MAVLRPLIETPGVLERPASAPIVKCSVTLPRNSMILFTGVCRSSPIGPVGPTGQPLEWKVICTFRYDDEGRLAEEWVQTDYRSFLTNLGVTTTETARTGEGRVHRP